MTKVIIHLAPNDMMPDFFFSKAGIKLVEDNLSRYIAFPAFETKATGEDAAEEAFDLTNNPTRQEERERKYGRHRSVSSGDVVEVDGVKWICMSIGWKQLV